MELFATTHKRWLARNTPQQLFIFSYEHRYLKMKESDVIVTTNVGRPVNMLLYLGSGLLLINVFL